MPMSQRMKAEPSYRAAHTRPAKREAEAREVDIVVFDAQRRETLRTTRARINEALDRAVRRDER